MRLYIITFLIFFSTTILFAQNKTLKIVYKEKMLENPIDTTGSKPSNFKKIMYHQMEKVRKTLDNVSYTLLANEKEAIFQYDDFLESDINGNKMDAIMASSADGSFYTNIQSYTNLWQIRGAHGDYVRIKEPEKLKNWKIWQEQKIVNGYVCYKATQKVLLNNRVEIIVEAWFTPDIPHPFGPKGYGGLPGLIIALNERGFYFYVDKITTQKNGNRIKEVKKGEIVSWEEYDKILKKLRSNL